MKLHINVGDFVYRKLPYTREMYDIETKGYEDTVVKFEDIPQPNKLEICAGVTTANMESPGCEIGEALIIIRNLYCKADDFLPYMP